MKRLALTCFEKQPIIQNNVIYDKLNELNMNLLLFLNEFTNIIFFVFNLKYGKYQQI